MQVHSVETVRLGRETKTHLSTLKKRTGIANWNTICRWAFCLSVSDSTPVRDREEKGSGAVEMTWKTFAGEDDEIYRLLLVDRCQSEHGTVDKETLAKTVRQHIARGAARLVSKRELKSISDLLSLVVDPATKTDAGNRVGSTRRIS
jgi:DNA sulfur modification protein DndE